MLALCIPMNGDGSPHIDTGDRRRRSDPKGVRAKVERATESTEAKFLARLAAPTIVIGLLTFFGLQLWDGQKDLSKQVIDIASTVSLHEYRLGIVERNQESASRAVGP